MNESSSISGCIGITVSGQGSFTFNNTDGIVNIGGFAGTVFDMSGGTIKLEGLRRMSAPMVAFYCICPISVMVGRRIK